MKGQRHFKSRAGEPRENKRGAKARDANSRCSICFLKPTMPLDHEIDRAVPFKAGSPGSLGGDQKTWPWRWEETINQTDPALKGTQGRGPFNDKSKDVPTLWHKAAVVLPRIQQPSCSRSLAAGEGIPYHLHQQFPPALQQSQTQLFLFHCMHACMRPFQHASSQNLLNDPLETEADSGNSTRLITSGDRV